MLPIMFLALAGSVGEPISARVAAIDQKARMYPPKRSPWHGTSEAAMKVTLWNGNGTAPPQKMKVDANLSGGRAQDFYWFDAGKVTYGTQSRWSGGEKVERRLTFTAGKLTAAEERRGSGAYTTVPAAELANLRSSVTSLLNECLRAPGLRERRALVKSVERDRVVLETAPGVMAWISRRSGDNITPSLVGKQVTYDFTAVDQDGQEMDFLNALRPAGAAVPVVSDTPAAPEKAAAAAPAVKPAVKKKTSVRKGAKRRARTKTK